MTILAKLDGGCLENVAKFLQCNINSWCLIKTSHGGDPTQVPTNNGQSICYEKDWIKRS